MLHLRNKPEGCEVAIRVQPGARRTGLAGRRGNALRIALHASPVEGKANAALIEFLSETTGVPQSRIHIIRGSHSRDKIILLQDYRCEAFCHSMDLPNESIAPSDEP